MKDYRKPKIRSILENIVAERRRYENTSLPWYTVPV